MLLKRKILQTILKADPISKLQLLISYKKISRITCLRLILPNIEIQKEEYEQQREGKIGTHWSNVSKVSV